ncbi:MAG: SDR family oxidoreductase [Sporichthyaceae bacterium]
MSAALQGKIAIVTGAGRGIGAAIAERFGGEGATVVVSDIDESAARKTAESIPGATHHVCDVRDEDAVIDLVESTVAQHGALHVMVANAGVGSACPILGMDLATWRATTSINLDGVFLSVRYAAPAIIAAGGGSILVLSSITATNGSPLLAPYAAAKAGVLTQTKTAATEFRAQGIRVNALLPAFIDTEMVSAAAPDFESLMGLPAGAFDGLIAQKQGRYGTIAEVAAAALFLTSDAAAFCTGTGLILDGGFTSSLL